MQTFFVVVKDEKGTTVSSGVDDPVNSSDDSREASGHSAGQSGGPVVTGVVDV